MIKIDQNGMQKKRLWPIFGQFCKRKNDSKISAYYLFIYLGFLLNAQNWTEAQGCQFFPLGEYLRFVRIPENLRIGDRVMSIEVHNRKNLTLESVEKGDDAKYFTLNEINSHLVEIQLARSLETIVDNESPQNILKFRLICYPEEIESTPSFLSMTVYVEDINDHAPQFVNAPYHVTVEELTPIGLTVFSDISAMDLDKPNTANSDIHFAIIEGNEEDKFTLESSHKPNLIIKNPLDYDSGNHEYNLKVVASDRGNPPLSTHTWVTVKVLDNNDLLPKFTKSLYSTQLKEFYPFHNRSIYQEILFSQPILAFDQDEAISSPIIYDILSGNDGKYFEINENNGSLFLVREIDRESINSSSFDLHLRARELENPDKFGLAKIEIELLDLNDNLPQFEVDIYNISIMENLPNGFSVVQVFAKDIDQGENAEFVYKLEDRTRAFAIDPKSGWLTVRDQNQLDREKIDSVKMKVFAEEKVPNIAYGPGVRSSAVIEVYLLDNNDGNPVFLPSNLYKFQVTLDSEIGSVVGQVTAEDPDLDGNGRVTYSFQRSNNSREDLPFEIDSKNGYIFLLERPLPRLQYTLLVEASDNPINPSETRYSLAVVQVDVVKSGSGHAPEFIGAPYEFWVGTTVGIGTSVGQVKVKDFDPKNTVYDLLHSYYEGVPFAIEERTGIIAVVDDLVKFTRSSYDFEAFVTDTRHTLTTNVTINIVDPVEGALESSREPIELRVKENVAGAVVGNLKTILQGTPGSRLENSRTMEYLLANYDARDKFAISSDGTIYTLKALDREEKSRHLLTVISQSRGVIQGHGVYQIFVNLEDENDETPKFEKQSYEGQIRENSNPGALVLLENPVKVLDGDEGINAQYTIALKGDGADKFRIDPKTGKIYAGNSPLDREERQLYLLKLIATDSGNLSSSVPISIHITDINDQAPVFLDNLILDPPDLDQTSGPRELLRSSSSHQPISVEIPTSEPIRIPETMGVGSRIARVMASDLDQGDNSKIFYRIVSENSGLIGEKIGFLTDKQFLFSRNKEKHFMIDRLIGEISIAKPLKPGQEYALNISASDRGGLRTYTGIRVVVEDLNNHSPVFSRTWYTFELQEGNYLRGEIGRVSAKDADLGINGKIRYSLRPKLSSQRLPFHIDENSGLIFVEGDIDREKEKRFSFQAIAKDQGAIPQETSVDVEVIIQDINDNKPYFINYMSTYKSRDGKLTPIYRTTVPDSIEIGSQVTQVYANDSDYVGNGNGIVLYHLANHHKEFYIDSKNGTISTLTNLDYDVKNEFNLTVVASDLGRPSLSSTAWVLVRLTPSSDSSSKNDLVGNKIRMFSREVFTFQIPPNATFPYFLTRIDTIDRFKRIPKEYDIFGEESVVNKFRIDPRSGKLYLDGSIESGRTYEFLVRAHSPRYTRGFDTRQGTSFISDRFLEPNEALIRVRMLPSLTDPVPPQLLPPPPQYKTIIRGSETIQKISKDQINKNFDDSNSIVRDKEVPSSSSPNPAIITKANLTPRIITSKNLNQLHGRALPPPPPSSTSKTQQNINARDPLNPHGKSPPQKNAFYSFYAGEIAVLTLSCVIFLGGLVAAISIACVRKKRRSRQQRHNLSGMPVDVRLQKQFLASHRQNNHHNRTTVATRSSTRPVIFPMALPGEPMLMQQMDGDCNTSSDTCDETHESPGRLINNSSKSYNNNFTQNISKISICPECRKIKRPNGLQTNHHRRMNNNGGPMKPRRDNNISLVSSNDSGIDDGQCNCCQHNSSSDSGREQYEDSLMPQMNQRLRQKRSCAPPPPPPMRNSNKSSNFRTERVVIL